MTRRRGQERWADEDEDSEWPRAHYKQEREGTIILFESVSFIATQISIGTLSLGTHPQAPLTL